MNFKVIREIIDAPDNRFGYSQEAINRTERRLNISIPEVLGAYYLQIAKHEINFQQDTLLVPDQENQKEYERLYIEEDVLVFYRENQNCHYWGIKKEDLNQNNPKVYRRENAKNASWILDTDNLSDFLISMAFWQFHFMFDFCAWKIDVKNADFQQVLNSYKKEPYIFKRWNVEFYRNHSNHLIAVHRIQEDYTVEDFSQLYVMTKTETAFNALSDQFDLEWDDQFTNQ